MSRNDTLRVGTVPFLVARPLDNGLEREHGIELVRDVPSRLVEALRAGELDVALVSSIELFRRPGYRYLDGLGVSGHAEVSSVQVFLRCALESVSRVALDPASRAARTLVRVLFAERRLAPTFIDVPFGADPRSIVADAWLRIGDEALRETLAADAPPTFNPSAAWRELTGLPFVFASWIVRPGVDIEPFRSAFAAARARGAARAEAVADAAATAWSIPQHAARHYLLEECLFEPGDAMRPSLFELRDRAAAIGLCEPDLAPEAVAIEDVRVP
jgi:chorismate dehydratase